MKSAVISLALLLAIFFCSLCITKSQSKSMEPVLDSINELISGDSASSRSLLEKSIKALEKNRFVIELGLPGDDFDKVYYLLKSAMRLLDTNDLSLYRAKLEECKIYLESLIEYSEVSLSSIL